MGSAAAHFLSAHPGFTGSVLVLEADPSYQSCATTRSLASIRHQFSTPGNIRMSQFGTDFIRDVGTHLAVDGETPDVGFVEAGYLFLASSAGLDTLHTNHRVQRQCGVDVALLAPDALAQRFPWLHTEDLAAGSLGLSGEGWLDAHSLMAAFRRKAICTGRDLPHRARGRFASSGGAHHVGHAAGRHHTGLRYGDQCRGHRCCGAGAKALASPCRCSRASAVFSTFIRQRNWRPVRW